MNRVQLRTELLRRNISPLAFDMDRRSLRSDCWVLEQSDNGKWVVFYTERGQNRELLEYDSEEEACADLLERLSPSGYP